jgi:hypothetical protein
MVDFSIPDGNSEKEKLLFNAVGTLTDALYTDPGVKEVLQKAQEVNKTRLEEMKQFRDQFLTDPESVPPEVLKGVFKVDFRADLAPMQEAVRNTNFDEWFETISVGLDFGTPEKPAVGNMAYDNLTNTLLLRNESMGLSSYMTPEGTCEREDIVHELMHELGHAADPRNTVQGRLDFNRGLFAQVLDEAVEASKDPTRGPGEPLPESMRNEYKEKGTMLGMKPDELYLYAIRDEIPAMLLENKQWPEMKPEEKQWLDENVVKVYKYSHEGKHFEAFERTAIQTANNLDLQTRGKPSSMEVDRQYGEGCSIPKEALPLNPDGSIPTLSERIIREADDFLAQALKHTEGLRKSGLIAQETDMASIGTFSSAAMSTPAQASSRSSQDMGGR